MDDFTNSGTDAGVLAMILGFGIAFMFIGLIVWLFYGFCMGRVFQKAGKPLWTGFVPIYNLVVWMEVIGKPMWWVAVVLGVGFISSWIPVIGWLVPWAVIIYLSIETAKAFGKDTTFGVLLGIFWPIMLPVLAFGDAQYQGVPESDRTFAS